LAICCWDCWREKEFEIAGIVGLDLKAGGQRVGVQLFDDRFVVQFAFQRFERLLLGDVGHRGDARHRFHFLFRRGDFRVGRAAEERELNVQLAVDFVGLRLRGLEDRDQHAEQDHGDDRGDDGGQRRRPVSAERPEGLRKEEDDSGHQRTSS
jgi:hypothetical protein